MKGKSLTPYSGLYWSTYKAVCRRNGHFNAADFNMQLTDPLLAGLGNAWERAFTRRIPTTLVNSAKTCATLVQQFHSSVAERQRQSGSYVAGMSMLGQQLRTYVNSFNDIAESSQNIVNEQQKEANRGFIPVITDRMIPAYEGCVAEYGPGSYARMKVLMQNHIEQQRGTMFFEATEAVKSQLTAMLRAVETEFSNRFDESTVPLISTIVSLLLTSY